MLNALEELLPAPPPFPPIPRGLLRDMALWYMEWEEVPVMPYQVLMNLLRKHDISVEAYEAFIFTPRGQEALERIMTEEIKRGKL